MNFSLFLDRITRFFWCIFAYIFRLFIKVRKNKVICWTYDFNQYSCNPKYITDYILSNCKEDYDIVWVFNPDVNITAVSQGVRIVHPRTLKYLYELYSSHFVITNKRNYKYYNFFFKKNSQLYIMTWHGSIPLKKIEYDANLGKTYERRMKDDNIICDLMLSGSAFWSSIIRNAFRYQGEILERGIPRNDLFFNKIKIENIREKIFREYNISGDTKIVMYAPTFREDGLSCHYKLDWQKLIPELEQMIGNRIVVFIRLHPNSLNIINAKELLYDERTINMCFYHDMQELLCVTDVLITDYSSSMFEIGLLNKICFLYADDVASYERGFYFDIRKMPFALAETEEQLIRNVQQFDINKYNRVLKGFYKNNINIYDNGHASEAVVNWMNNHKCKS